MPITAVELMAELEADPEWVTRRKAKDDEFEKLDEECRSDEAELLTELKEIGINVESVWDLVNNGSHSVLNHKPLGSYERAYPILVRHLDVTHHSRIREGIIRSLSEKAARQIALTSLLEHLKTEQERCIRWAIANALQSMLSKSELKHSPEITETLRAGYL